MTLLWGSTFVITKGVVQSGTPPLAYLATRFVLATLVLVMLFPSVLRRSRAVYRDGMALGLGQGVGLLLQVLGQVYTTASKSAFVTAFATALTPAFALVLYRLRPGATQLVAVMLATAGLALLTWPAGSAAWNRGDLLSAACAFVYAWVIVETTRRAPRHHAGELTTVQTATAALLFVTAFAVAHGALPHLPPVSRPDWLVLEARPIVPTATLAAQVLYMALVCTVGTFLVQTWAMARMSATHAAVMFSLEPVWATVVGLAVFGGEEWPGTRGAAGAALIVLGVILSEWKRSDGRSDR